MSHEIEEGHDGLFSLCVFNADQISEAEVRNVFEKYGTVVRVNRTNSATFVRYNTREEAVSCFESMQNDARFNVRPGKKRVSGGTNPESTPTSKNYPSFEHHWKLCDLCVNAQTKQWDIFPLHKFSFNCTTLAALSGNGSKDMNRSGDSRGSKNESFGDSGYKARGAGGNKPGVGPPPKLIPYPYLPPEEDKTNAPHAKLVFLGNLHPDMKQNNIYELCGKANAPPLHVAMKKLTRPPYPTMHYAYVYVKDEKDVENIVKSLDKLKLNGYRLIASSVEKMAEEGRDLLKNK